MMEHAGSAETFDESQPLQRERPASDVALGHHNQNPAGMSLLALWREDYITHERDLLSQGFWALAVHRFGNWRMGVRFRLLRWPLSFLYKILYKWVEWTCGISLVYTVRVGRRVHIWHQGGMVLVALSIGDEVHLRHNTTFGVRRRNDPRWMRPTIGDRCDIGAGAVIVGAITVGHDSVIGANVVLAEDVPPYSVVIAACPEVRSRQRSASITPSAGA